MMKAVLLKALGWKIGFTLNLSVTVMSKFDAALLSSCCAVKPSPEYMMTCSAKDILCTISCHGVVSTWQTSNIC